MRKRLMAAALCAIAAMACGFLYLQDVQAHLSGGRPTAILVAAREIAPGTRIAESDLAIRQVPESYVHPEAVLATASDEKKVLGRPIAVRIIQGQPLLLSDFESQKTRLGKGLSGSVQKGQRAFTIPVDVSGSFANQIRPGDRVDVLSTLNRTGHEATVTILQNLLVLSVGSRRDDAEPEQPTNVAAVTLSVDLDEAEVLVFAMHHGVLNLTLHGDEDIDVVTDIGQKSFADLFEDQRRTALVARRVRPRSSSKIQELTPERTQP